MDTIVHDVVGVVIILLVILGCMPVLSVFCIWKWPNGYHGDIGVEGSIGDKAGERQWDY